VSELVAYIQGEIGSEEAIRRAVVATGQYAKRQTTWFRHHSLASTDRLHTIDALHGRPAQFSERLEPDMVNFVESRC